MWCVQMNRRSLRALAFRSKLASLVYKENHDTDNFLCPFDGLACTNFVIWPDSEESFLRCCYTATGFCVDDVDLEEINICPRVKK